MTTTVISGAERWLQDEQRRTISLGYRAFPKQCEFHQCPAKYRLFGGAAGPGKSKALLMEAVAQALHHRGANTLLLRRTFPELEGSLLLYFRRDVPREFYRSFNEARHTVTWCNGSTTRFGYSQSENDIYQYQSSEFLFIGVDELTHFTLRQWQFLTSRNRCPVADSRPCMAGATNPGNIGHAWVKSLFIDKQPAPGMDPREYDPRDYAFISARVTDNPIYASDSAYLRTLEQLPDFYRRAFLDGDWSVFAGQYFSNFDPSLNVMRAESLAAEPWWPRWISIDWGFEHPAAVYWHTAAPSRPNIDCHSERVPAHSVGATGNLRLPSEPQRHRPADSQTHEPGIGHSAKNLPNPPAGDAAPHKIPELHQHAGRASQFPTSPHADSSARGAQSDAPASPHHPSTHFARLASPPFGASAPLPYGNFVVTGFSFAATQASGEPEHAAFDDMSRHVASTPSNVVPPHSFSHPERSACASAKAKANASSVVLGGARRGPQVDGKSSLGDRLAANACASPAASSVSPSAYENASALHPSAPARAVTVTYREFTAQHLAPRILAAQIIERSRLRDGRAEKIDAIYLSPDAFARRTDEASIAEQMGDILAAAGLPRPTPADNDRIGGWMLMYQMLDAREWFIADSCPELIRTLPELVRDSVHVEDIAKRDGDDPADAARYGLKSRASAPPATPPREQQFAERLTSSDPTIRAIQARKAELDLRNASDRVVLRPGAKPHHRSRWRFPW